MNSLVCKLLSNKKSNEWKKRVREEPEPEGEFVFPSPLALSLVPFSLVCKLLSNKKSNEWKKRVREEPEPEGESVFPSPLALSLVPFSLVCKLLSNKKSNEWKKRVREEPEPEEEFVFPSPLALSLVPFSLVCKLLSNKKSNEWKKRVREEPEPEGESVFPSPLALSLVPFSFLLSMCALGTLAQPATAEGSRQLTFDTGDRAYLEYRSDNTANIPRRASIKVYVRPGEELNLGSSAVGLGQGTINYTRPDGSQGSCGTQGRINNIDEEVAGPLPNAGGYTPCRITVEQNQEGIWEIFFISPNPNNLNDNPPPLGVRERWTQADNVFWIAAWDISVRPAPGSTDVIRGRAYANYLPLNLGAIGRSLEAPTIILTRDGYQYRVDPRGLDPFGFLFFANNKGFTTAPGGNPLYRSVEAPENQLPPVQRPTDDRNDINTPDVTHKIFLNPPSTDLPPTARIAGGSTWLLSQPVPPPAATNFRFVGEEGTENQAGTNPLTGTFSFNAPSSGPYSIVLDINGDGNFGNENDRIFFGQATSGENRVPWDGLDGRGQRVPAGEQRYRASIVLYAGEVHFPLIDAENNPRGGVIQRLTPIPGGGGSGSIFDPFSVYYDDRDLRVRPDRGDVPPNPLFAFGISSQNGAHAYGTSGQLADNRGFGDERGIDTWVFTPSQPTFLSAPITLKEADLAIQKDHEPANPVAGGQVTYVITVRNNGPSDLNTEGQSNAIDAQVTDTIPDALTNVTWTCEASQGSTCRTPNGQGNNIDTRVNLRNGGTATFRVTGTLRSDIASGTTVRNDRAVVARPNDVTDPNDVRREGINNNIDDDVFTVGASNADVRIEKVREPNSDVTPGSEIRYTIRVIAEGSTPSNNVRVEDATPQGLEFLRNEGDCTSAFPCNFGNLQPGQTRTFTSIFRVPAGYTAPNPILNAATVTSDNDSNPNNNRAEVRTNVTTTPPAGINVRIEKTGPGNIAPGSEITYQIRVTAEGGSASTGVQLSDQTPQGLNLVRVEGSGCTTLPCNLGDIPNGESRTVNVTFSVPANYNGPNLIVNTATVTSGNDSNPNDNSATVNTTPSTQPPPPPGANVRVEKTGPDSVTPGNNITYQVRVIAEGNTASTGVQLSDQTPQGLTLVGVEGSGCTSFPCNLGDIPNGQDRSVSVTFSVPTGYNGPSPIANTATVTSGNDSNPNDNNATKNTNLSTPTSADVVATKTGPSTVAPNGSITYNITVTNNGPAPAANVVVRDTLPAGVTFNSASDGGTAANGVVSFPAIPSLAPNTSVNRTITVTAPASGDPLLNVVSSTSDTPDPTPANNDGSQPPARVTTTITQTPTNADVVATKTGPATVAPNGSITYNITVRNNGPAPAANVVVRDTLPAGVTFNSASDGGTAANGVVTFPAIPSLAPNTSVNRTITVTAPASGDPLLNVVSSTSDTPDPTPNNNDGSQPPARVTTTITQTPTNADVVATKTGPATVAPNGSITYNITVTNNGPNPAANVVVRDTLPAGITFNSASDGGTAANGVVTFPPIPSLAPGTTVTRTIAVTAPASGGPLQNVVSSTSDTPDPTPANNDGSQPPARVTTTLTQTPANNADVVATKTGPATVAPNGSITYNITIRNNGPAPANNVVVRDNLPGAVTFNSASDGGTAANGVVTFPPIPTLAPGTSVTRTIIVTAPASGDPLLNVVSSTSDTPDPTPNNNDGSQPPARVTTTLTQAPPANTDVVTVKTGPGTVTGGGTITYTITTTNNGPAPATNVVIRDTLPQGVTFNSASDGGTAANGVVTFPPIPSLAPNTSVTRTITITAPTSGGPLLNVASSTADTPDPTPANNNGTQPPAQVTTTITPAVTDVQVTETGPTAPVPVGTNITFTSVVTNNGPTVANQVTFTNPLPPNVTVVSSTPSQGACGLNGNTVNCNLGDLTPGQSVTIPTVVTPTAPGNINNPVTVSAANDSNPNNNNATAPAQVIVPQTDIEVIQTGPTEPLPVGNNVTFNISVTNRGPVTGTAVTLTNPLPEGTTLVSATPTQGTCTPSGNIINCNLGDLNPSQTVNIPVVVNTTRPGTITNPATIASPNDSNPANNQATAVAQIVAREPRIRVVKRITSVIRNGSTSVFSNFVDDPADQNDNAPGWSQFRPVGVTAIGASESLRSGDTVEYTIYFLSDGNIPAQNVNICDAIPANTTFIPDSFVPGSGIQLNRAGTINSLTNAQDDDAGRFFSPLAPLPTGNPCSDQGNANGTVLFNLNQVPNAPGSNFGFVRFRVTID